MKTKLLTIATMAVLMLTAMTKGQAQTPCLPQEHGLMGHQSALCGITQTIQLAEGWNWVSLSIEVEDPIVTLQMLEDALIDNGMHIESDGLGTENLGGFWVGDLDEVGLTNEQMFLIEVSTDCSVALQGTPVNPANHEITINHGWNWIGFPCTQELPINDAMAGFEAEDEDLIEGQDDQAVYFFGEWVGFETLVPGQGYLYYSNSNDTKTLTFQTGAKARRAYPNFGKIKTQPIEVIPTEGE